MKGTMFAFQRIDGSFDPDLLTHWDTPIEELMGEENIPEVGDRVRYGDPAHTYVVTHVEEYASSFGLVDLIIHKQVHDA